MGALALMVLATPLDLVAQRLATLRLKPLSPAMFSRRMLWPAAGLALLALGWFETRHGSGWGAIMDTITAGTCFPEDRLLAPWAFSYLST